MLSYALIVGILLATGIVPLVKHLQLNSYKLDASGRVKAKIIAFWFERIIK